MRQSILFEFAFTGSSEWGKKRKQMEMLLQSTCEFAIVHNRIGGNREHAAHWQGKNPQMPYTHGINTSKLSKGAWCTKIHLWPMHHSAFTSGLGWEGSRLHAAGVQHTLQPVGYCKRVSLLGKNWNTYWGQRPLPIFFCFASLWLPVIAHTKKISNIIPQKSLQECTQKAVTCQGLWMDLLGKTSLCTHDYRLKLVI
jgi:hypothetical protein